jgi:hypothetical protein
MTAPRTPHRRLPRGVELDPNAVADELEHRGMVRRRPVVPVIEPLGPLEDFPDDPTQNPERARAVIAAAGITPTRR